MKSTPMGVRKSIPTEIDGTSGTHHYTCLADSHSRTQQNERDALLRSPGHYLSEDDQKVPRHL